MHGMDIGSMPLFREMVQGGIKKVLSSYVTPKFITLDIAAILDQQRRARMYVVSLFSFTSLDTPFSLFLTEHCFSL
jgi:Ca2+-dependent lipid-binding protein